MVLVKSWETFIGYMRAPVVLVKHLEIFTGAPVVLVKTWEIFTGNR
jgi:hypothetical protein